VRSPSGPTWSWSASPVSCPSATSPGGTALVAASLGLLAAGAAPHLHLDGLLSGSGNFDLLRIAALLWHASLARLDVHVTPGQFARVGIKVVVPALSAAFIGLLVMRPVLGG